MRKTRRKFTSVFKAQIAIEAVRERESLADMAKKYEVHPNQISKWKQEFLEKSAQVFDLSGSEDSDEKQVDSDKLYAKIGELQLEVDFLKKSLQKGIKLKNGWN